MVKHVFFAIIKQLKIGKMKLVKLSVDYTSTDVYVTNRGGSICIRYFLMVKCSFFAIKIQRKVKFTKSIKISVNYVFFDNRD